MQLSRLVQPVVICAMLDAISALQMCAQTLTDALVEWHQATRKQYNPCHGQAEEECYFAGIAFLPESLGSHSAWQYFVDNGLQACTEQLEIVAQQTLNRLGMAGDCEMTSTVSHADIEALLHVLSKLCLYMHNTVNPLHAMSSAQR